MNAQHTPGPWSIHKHMDGAHVTECPGTEESRGFVAHSVPFGAGDVLLGEVVAYKHDDGKPSGHPTETDFDVNLANARLIVAAPDLLAALLRCRFDSLNMSFDDLAFCRAAISKALGEAA